MGTVISLEVSGMELDWSKNSLGIDHGGLFQSADHHVKPLNEDQIEEGEDFDTPDGILCRTVLRKPLGQVAYRLELLGFTLENMNSWLKIQLNTKRNLTNPVRNMQSQLVT